MGLGDRIYLGFKDVGGGPWVWASASAEPKRLHIIPTRNLLDCHGTCS